MAGGAWEYVMGSIVCTQVRAISILAMRRDSRMLISITSPVASVAHGNSVVVIHCTKRIDGMAVILALLMAVIHGFCVVGMLVTVVSLAYLRQVGLLDTHQTTVAFVSYWAIKV